MTMMTLAPDRSLEQRRAAMRRANEIRTFRSQLKRDIEAHRVDVRSLLLDPGPRRRRLTSSPRAGWCEITPGEFLRRAGDDDTASS